MPIKSYSQAICDALDQEMARDKRVILIGQDVRGGAGGSADEEVEAFGGTFGVTKGLWTKYGSDRVIDTPISEASTAGMAAGAALTGMRPVFELMFMSFFGYCYDSIHNQAARFRYMFGGQAKTPLVVRGLIGAGLGASGHHAQSPYNVFTASPGLKVVCPSNPYDAKGLLIAAIRDDDPVIFCEHMKLLNVKDEVPDESYEIPLGVANYTRRGNDVTIIAISSMVSVANNVADKLAKDGISVEVIDPRSISPLDEETILESVKNTGRVVIVDESAARASIAHDISAMIAQNIFHSLRAPIEMVLPPHTPVPFATELENAWLPSETRVEETILRIVKDNNE